MLTVVTAAIHFTFAFPTPKFIASGVGYLLLLGAFLAPPLRRFRGAVGAALALFAVGNIVAWYLQGPRIPIAYGDKVVEVTLLLVLLTYAVLSRQRSAQPVRVMPSRQRQ